MRGHRTGARETSGNHPVSERVPAEHRQSWAQTTAQYDGIEYAALPVECRILQNQWFLYPVLVLGGPVCSENRVRAADLQ
jgi:hypothetical protein